MLEIRLDKISSTTFNLKFGKKVEISEDIPAEAGTVIAVKALEEKLVYDMLELSSGRLAKISKGDTIAGVLGRRSALKGFVGIIPNEIKPGDILNILNIGGVIGQAISYNREYGKPLRVEVIGSILINGKPANIKDASLPLFGEYEFNKKLVVVSGTNMNCGKTITVSKIIKGLSAGGLKVGAGKVTGIGALKDTLNMLDHGAVRAISFLDFGYPSTVGIEKTADIAKSIVKYMESEGIDIVVLELGDGIFGEYGVNYFFEDNKITKNIFINVVCATDQVGAWGILKYMNNKNLSIDFVSGPVTDNIVGIKFIENTLKTRAINSIDESEKISEYILNKFK